MANIVGREETLTQMFPGEALGKLTNGITDAIALSFCDDNGKMRKDVPATEIKDRFTVCVKMAKMLRGDLKWGLDRICGQMPEIIRCHLAKIDYIPPVRQCWLPEDGTV